MNNTIGQKIRYARKMAGLTQREAAEKAGVSQMTIRRVEKNFRNPSVEMTLKIANALGVHADFNDIFTPANEMETVQGMTLNDYQTLAARTINKNLYPEQMAMHAMHGMVGEVGELHGIYQKGYQGHEIDYDHLKKELGDLLWFAAEYCTAMGWTLEDVARMNIEKLKARYPEGFDAQHSLHRKEGDI